MATPLSIDQFKLAISPSDKDNIRVVDWMDRLQSSTQQTGQASAARMEIIREMRRSGAVSSSVPGARTSADAGVRSSTSHAMDDSDDAVEEAEEAATEEEDAEKVRSALPDVTVPIGLLANLSLDKENDKDKGRSRARPGGTGSSSAALKPEEDDNNVVCVSCFGSAVCLLLMGVKGVANKEYFRPGMSSVAAVLGRWWLSDSRTRSGERPQYSEALDRKKQSPGYFVARLGDIGRRGQAIRHVCHLFSLSHWDTRLIPQGSFWNQINVFYVLVRGT